MKIKLTHAQFFELLKQYEELIEYKPDNKDIKEHLLFYINLSIYQKLRKLDDVFVKGSYSLKLDATQALGFFIYWNKHNVFPVTSFLGNLITQISNSIHQQMQ